MSATPAKSVFLSLATFALATAWLHADVFSGTLSTNWTGSQAIPDNNPNGVAFSFNISTPVFAAITNVTLDLNTVGGWNGDLYAYLSHGSGFAVLLNRVGRNSANPNGSSSSGMTVEFADSYLADIHAFAGSSLTGNFAPDGRNVNPFTVLDSDPRTAMLGSFTGLDPSGNWTLFFADVGPLSVSTVQSWTLTLGVTIVPEPAAATLLALSALLAMMKTSGIRSKKRAVGATV
jgi:subtilisin-like proprotein convertase family protein